MSKKKKKNPKTRRQHSGSQKQNQQAQQRIQREQREQYSEREQLRDAPNSGANRQQKREQNRKPHVHRSSKPIWLRVAIIVVLVAILLGFVLVPLLSMH